MAEVTDLDGGLVWAVVLLMKRRQLRWQKNQQHIRSGGGTKIGINRSDIKRGLDVAYVTHQLWDG